MPKIIKQYIVGLGIEFKFILLKLIGLFNNSKSKQYEKSIF